MTQHVDIFDQPESLRNPFLGSFVFHVAVFGALVLANWQYDQAHQNWGSNIPSGGGSVAISPVKTIPLPARHGPKNPVASDTESVVPAAPRKEVAKPKVKPPDPTAIAIRSKTQPKPSPTDSSNLRYRPETTYKPNQIYSPQAPAAVSQMFAKTGAGTIGLDQNSVLGSRFGGYAALLMQRVAERWHTNGLEGVHAPYAIVAVDIFRNGTTRNVKLTQSSGNYQLDTSALRAVTEAAPLPPLPAEYERDMVNVEFRFQIQK